MLDTRLARAAFRTRAESLVVATTGSVTLSATATGYARTTGSFITDGFVKGMELVPSGFTLTTPAVITAVTALAMTVSTSRTVEAANSGRTLTVGLPTMHSHDNDRLTPLAGRNFISSEWKPGGSGLETMPASDGFFLEDGLSIWKWYGTPGVGSDPLDISIKKLKQLFTPGTTLSLSDGSKVAVRGKPSFNDSGIERLDSWAVVVVKIPWRAWTRNAIAA